MKKLLAVSILCTALLCGCSPNGETEISETSALETSSAAVTTESLTETVTTTKSTTAETTEKITENSEESLLIPIRPSEPFEIVPCFVREKKATDDKNELPEEVLKRAREICFADEEIRWAITDNNNADGEYGVPPETCQIETAEDIPFMCGVEYDFDDDGEYEYVISLDYYPAHRNLSGGFVIYFDGDKYEVLVNSGSSLRAQNISVITGGNYEYDFLKLDTAADRWWFSDDIYSFESGMPEKAAIDCGESSSIYFENDIFYLRIKWWESEYPFVLCGDGVFRQLGREELTREDFEARVKNGGAYLDSLAENGEMITEIYTYGHYSYELCGEDFCYELSRVNNVFKPNRLNYVPEEMRFTDEVVYGGNVWAAQTTRSCDYDIGGGYVCYKTGEAGNKILNVAKDNVITDSIELSKQGLFFDHDWQIKFYDMDTPPCFALETGSYTLNYRTYFVIDGKIREMNWTLDGEPLDSVYYTMLPCRGEKNSSEFVSYSIPVWSDDCYTKWHFTFADGDYTNIVGYTEDIDDKIMKCDDDCIRHALQNLAQDKNSEAAYEVMSKFFGFWSSAYNAEKSTVEYVNSYAQIEEEGFRTKEEMMNTLSEFCTPAAAEEVYSMLVESIYSDLKIIDGRFYLFDGAPSNYLPDYFIETAEEKDGVITARFFAYYVGQDIPYRILPPLYAEFVQEGGVWKISSLPKEIAD